MIPDALRNARRPLCLGIGGGGDVVGALATAEHCRLEYGARPVLGGVTWERRPIDPEPGPRKAAEIEGARPAGPATTEADAGGAAAERRAGGAAAERRAGEAAAERRAGEAAAERRAGEAAAEQHAGGAAAERRAGEAAAERRAGEAAAERRAGGAAAEQHAGGAAAERRATEAAAERRATEADAGSPVLLASAHTRVRSSGVRFAESRIAELLGEDTVLVDANHGPAAIAAGLRDAAAALGCDLVVFVDVGGDVLAHGDEPGLASPLCDSVLLAAALHMAERPTPGVLDAAAGVAPRATPAVLGAIFGIGCDGELTPDEVLARIDEVGRHGGMLGRLGITAQVAARLADAVEAVPTEASALALRAFHGESGLVEIRDGRRTVDLRPLAAATTFFDPVAAAASAARLAAAVRDAADLQAANEILNRLGVRTELDYENEMATSV